MGPWENVLARDWESALSYLAEKLGQFLRPGDVVMLCLEGSCESLLRQAAALCGVQSVSWGEDRRWKSLLKLAFTCRAAAIVAEPLVILGLGKLKSTQNTPLFLRNAVTVGYGCPEWMTRDIEKSLDCRCYHSFGLGRLPIAAGFSCGLGHIHLRCSAYALEIPSEGGGWVLRPKADPSLSFATGERGRLEDAPCPCGDHSPRVMSLTPPKPWDGQLTELARYLLSWASVLDCRIRRGDYGLELEMVVLPGQALPKLPTCARQDIKIWDPEQDRPFDSGTLSF